MSMYMSEMLRHDIDDRGFQDNKEKLLVTSAGVYEEKPYEKILIKSVNRKLGRRDYHLVYIPTGRIDLTVNQSVKSISKGFFLIPPNTPYSYICVDENEPFFMCWMHFTGNQSSNLLKTLNIYDEYTFRVGNIKEIIELTQQLVEEMSFKNEGYLSMMSAILIKILVTLSRNIKQPKKQKSKTMIDLRTQKALDYIKLHYQSNITIKEIADFCDLSVSRFSSLFKSDLNMSPLQYINMFRLQKATELLTETPYPITDISISCGFADAMYFSRVFRKQYGISPTKYRKSTQKQASQAKKEKN